MQNPNNLHELRDVSPKAMQHATLSIDGATPTAIGTQQPSLKALAYKVLERNAISNNHATRGKTKRNFSPENSYKKLHEFDDPFSLSYDEIKIACGEDWQEVTNDHRLFSTVSDALRTRRMMERGSVPPHYTKTVICKHCGTVKLWEGASNYVLGCPWCLIISSNFNEKMKGERNNDIY